MADQAIAPPIPAPGPTAQPSSLWGVVVYICEKYGNQILSLVVFVVVIATLVTAYRAVGPDVQALKVIAEKNAETAATQLQIQNSINDSMGAARGLVEMSSKILDRLEKATDRLDHINR